MLRLLPLLLTACTTPAAESPEDPLLMRSYTVPPGHAAQLDETLRYFVDVNATTNNRQPRTRLSPDGKLLVIAPEAIQQGVAELVQEMSLSQIAPPPTIRLQCWIVVGEAAEADAIPAELAAIGEALGTISAASTPQRYHLVERISQQAAAGQRAETSGLLVRLEQLATLIDGRVSAELGLKLGPLGELDTQLSLAPEQTLVLGEVGVDSVQLAALVPRLDLNSQQLATLYYVIRAEVSGQ